MSTSFGKWYEDQQAEQSGASSSSWFDIEQAMPMISTEGMPNISFDGMKQSLEASMPKKIMGMGYQQRFQVFCALLFLSALFFALAFFMGLPWIAIHPQKFALSFTCGSLTFMGSFGILKGPKEHIQSMCTADRMYFTTIYVGSMLMTLYFTFSKGGIQGYVLVLASSGVQLVALLWYLVSFLPGGRAGLAVVSRAICVMLQPILKGCFRLQAMCFSTCFSFWTRS
eukprot:Nitzschia sp. Nitz4//scaffold14_size191712//83823//84567//NITZ4_001718-RA/size191712-snap-gene-0.133-mRNA-1//1//CDS//3329536912//18//frame0